MSQGMENRGRRSVSDRKLPERLAKTPDAGSFASLAALTLQRQTPGLLLPTNLSLPASFSLVQGDDKALLLARSLVTLGLGSVDAWKRQRGNCSLFVRTILNDWLEELGVRKLRNRIDLDVTVTDESDGMQIPGKLLFFIDTSDGCGYIEVGAAVQTLEDHAKGLGRAFYDVLSETMNRWMYVYDFREAGYFFERWKETVGMDMEGEGIELTPENFDAYCVEGGINIPDDESLLPFCLRHDPGWRSAGGGRKSGRASLELLRQHREGPHAAWIGPVLAMATVKRVRLPPLEQAEELWDDSPLPNWLLAFHRNDPVTQAFDEESQTMNEMSHAPAWVHAVDPGNVAEVAQALRHIRDLLRVNLCLVELADALERKDHHGSKDRHSLDHQLRAA